MPLVRFTRQLARAVACPPATVEGATIGEALAAYFIDHPGVRGYVLDDQGGARKHVAMFVNGEPIGDRVRLSDPVTEADEIDVLQALSGG